MSRSKEDESQFLRIFLLELETALSESEMSVANMSVEISRLTESNEKLKQEMQLKVSEKRENMCVCLREKEGEREYIIFTNFFQESNLNRINDLWRSQLRKMIVKLLVYLSKYPSTETPSFQSIFGDDDPTQIAVDRAHASDENVKLAATNDVIFYTMLSILKLQPYANPVSSVRICFAPSILLPKSQSILESISPTFHEQLCGF